MGMSRHARKSTVCFACALAVRAVCAMLSVVGALFVAPSANAADASRPLWTGSVDALLLWRDGPASRPLYFESADPASVPLDAGGIATGMAAGPRFAIEWSRNGTDAVEFNYFNIQSFHGARSVDSPGGQLEQASILGFNFPDVTAATADASAGIKSFELNRRLNVTGWEGDFLYGFRWVEWSESLRISDTTLSGIQTCDDTFLTNTISSLYGAQVGLDLLQTRHAGLVVRNVPLVDGNARLGLELGRGLVIAGIVGGHLVACRLQRLRNRRPDATAAAGHHCYPSHCVLLVMFCLFSPPPCGEGQGWG